ncbi:phosphotransferase family protein [Novosphingobium mangrovi (ex Huang et al. 2023)]|uniref:Phosphotransferase family protein n=1 Tax=Novosphingobium mangrovi (ex Huang et al. 2023) TaxID=2976432 RepID=A0ABT2I3V2_9SPHN|nr:phosphotransferase family protein [Novosphingobium mangrovi (ex Huang et al. 2023)]MCT2399313.1 phosphotransferase family protein [Novosphingobium mangrovi (ex Huang et al. 2023)]
MARDTRQLAEGLRSWLDRGEGVTGVKVLSAGHSNETYLVEGLNEILRMPPSEEGLLPPYDMVRQHQVMSAVEQHSAVPMPPMLELCTDPAVLGDPFFLMGAVQGEAFEYAVPEWLAADPVEGADAVCRQWFDAVAALHTMDPALMPPGGRSVSEEIAYWLKVAREAEAMPALIRVLEDLDASPPRTTGAATPVHGDPKHGNCMWDKGRLTVLLDWEMAQISEPMLDLGYILMFHGQGEASLADAGFDLPGWWSWDRMVAEWEQRTGRTAVDVMRYAVLGQAKVSAIISVGAHLFRTGRIKDPRFEGFAMVLPAYVGLLENRAMAA